MLIIFLFFIYYIPPSPFRCAILWSERERKYDLILIKVGVYILIWREHSIILYDLGTTIL